MYSGYLTVGNGACGVTPMKAQVRRPGQDDSRASVRWGFLFSPERQTGASAPLARFRDEHSDRHDAMLAFLALALADTGRERAGISAALAALAPHLARYQRSVATYARLLVEPETDS